jgi:arylsulfatase A-like enzyme
MNAICLVFDRLHAGYVGAYGNSWIETPSFDRLASQAILFDRALIDSPELARLYRSYWQGWHALCPAAPESRPSLAALLGQAGVTTVLLTDEPQVARHQLAADFDELIEIDLTWQPHSAAAVELTHFGRCFAQFIDWLETARGPFLLWCHLGGLGTTWDAPLKFRQAYCEEGDPPPPETADVPDRMLPADYDPDELLGVLQSYSGQMTLLDTCLGAFLDYFYGLPISSETLLTVTSARGFPLGEHGRIGPCDGALFGETVHVPWMMQFPDAAGAAVRSQALVEPADLWASLLDWWGIADVPRSPTAESVLRLVRQESGVKWDSPIFVDHGFAAVPAKIGTVPRDRLCIAGGNGQRAFRTPAWHLRAGLDPELYAKPDDRWEINNVASRCQDVVECLQDALTQYELALPDGRISDLPPLSDVLVKGLE